MENQNRLPGSEIRTLLWGLIPNQPYRSIRVGGTIKTKGGTYIITEIVEDKNTFIEYGYFEYLVYVSADGKVENQFLQSRFNKLPDQIEYFLPDGDHAEEFYM